MTTTGEIIVGIMALLTVASVAFAVKFYIELYRWARLCQNTTIAVAYKNKVKLNASMVEWMLWTKQVQKGGAGQTIYALGGTRVAIIKGTTGPRKRLGARTRGTTHAPRSRPGVWQVTENQGKKV